MIFKDVQKVCDGLLNIKLLYESGLRGNDKELYLKLDSTAAYLSNFDTHYYRKFKIHDRFKSLLKYSDLSLDIIKLNNEIDFPEDYNKSVLTQDVFFYRNPYAEKKLNALYVGINSFIEEELSEVLENLYSLFEEQTFIDIDKFEILLDETSLSQIKELIFKNVKMGLLNYSVLKLYRYKHGSKDQDFNSELWNFTDFDTPVDFDGNRNVKDLLNDLPVNKILQIASDFNLDIGMVKLKMKSKV